MPLKGFTCEQTPWSLATIKDCEKCSKPCMPIEVLRALWIENFETPHEYHSDPKVVSLTTSIGCLRKAYYDRTQDYGEVPQKLMARATGTVLHRWLEEKSPEGAEVVYDYLLSRGYMFKATADVSTPGVVKDYKTVDRPTKTLGGAVFHHEDGTKVHQHCYQLSAIADMMELVLGDDVGELSIIQVSRKDAVTHDAYRVPGALNYCVERAELLIDALEAGSVKALPRDGESIRFYRSTMCGFCPFAGECLGG